MLVSRRIPDCLHVGSTCISLPVCVIAAADIDAPDGDVGAADCITPGVKQTAPEVISPPVPRGCLRIEHPVAVTDVIPPLIIIAAVSDVFLGDPALRCFGRREPRDMTKCPALTPCNTENQCMPVRVSSH